MFVDNAGVAKESLFLLTKEKVLHAKKKKREI